MQIWCEDDSDDEETGWLDLNRLADPDSVERVELFLQLSG